MPDSKPPKSASATPAPTDWTYRLARPIVLLAGVAAAGVLALMLVVGLALAGARRTDGGGIVVAGLLVAARGGRVVRGRRRGARTAAGRRRTAAPARLDVGPAARGAGRGQHPLGRCQPGAVCQPEPR